MNDLLQKLSSNKAADRKSAAKKFRKEADIQYGEHLLSALKKEMEDPRTWEIKYHLIMALGACGYEKSLSELETISKNYFQDNMVGVALGDSIFRLNGSKSCTIDSFFHNRDLFEGATRALAMQKLIPSHNEMDRIISFCKSFSLEDGIIFWVIAAAPGWIENKNVVEFITSCLSSNREDIKESAKLALEGKYKKWRPL
ncbi:hypothetical protein [Catenovulum sediminis]|uniref:HEAT repeat domain-containing protein n=1 Tax=Catenovulum sediminis TaxID=1740262 RepID=A0ABV1RGL7_9ALTE